MRFDRESLARLRGQITAHVVFSMRTALEAVQHNKLRASLTSLGILFGVASVIAMLAIGRGAEQEILEQMRLLGSNNIVITPLVEQKEEKAKDEGAKIITGGGIPEMPDDLKAGNSQKVYVLSVIGVTPGGKL